MASGKSTIGKQLSEKVFVPFIDLDEYIELKENSSITNIFKEKGEIYFRKIEHRYLKELLSLRGSFCAFARRRDSLLRKQYGVDIKIG